MTILGERSTDSLIRGKKLMMSQKDSLAFELFNPVLCPSHLFRLNSRSLIQRTDLVKQSASVATSVQADVLKSVAFVSQAKESEVLGIGL